MKGTTAARLKVPRREIRFSPANIGTAFRANNLCMHHLPFDHGLTGHAQFIDMHSGVEKKKKETRCKRKLRHGVAIRVCLSTNACTFDAAESGLFLHN